MQQQTNHRNGKPQNIPGRFSAMTDLRVAVKGPSSSTSGSGDAREESKYGKKALKKGVRKGGDEKRPLWQQQKEKATTCFSRVTATCVHCGHVHYS